MFKPTKEQERIFHFIKNRKENIIIDAKAGVGKTTTIVEATKILPKDSKKIFLAFNKHIQEELKQKLPDDVYCYTFHGLGAATINRVYKNIKFDEFKVDHIIKKKAKSWKLEKELPASNDRHRYLLSIKKLVDLCRLTLTLDKKYVPYVANRHDIKLGRDKDFKRVFSILEAMMNDKKTYDYIDMIFLPAIDSKLWMFQYDYVIVDEIQDLNRAQQKIIEKILKRNRVTKKVEGRLIGVGDPHQCQPEGTKILMHDGSQKNIEEIKVGDLVVSYNRKEKGSFVGRYRKKVNSWLKERAPKVEEIERRKIDGNLVEIKSGNKTSQYTYNHRCMVRFKKESLNKYVMYLMRKGDYYRIGIVKYWNGKNDFGSFRARQENADDFWVLKSYDNKFDAYIEEQYYSLKYKIPQIIFNYRNQKGNIDQKVIDKFYSKLDLDALKSNVDTLLKEFNRNINYPFWSKNKKTYFSKNHMFELHACNILKDDMQVIHYDEKNLTDRTHGNAGKPSKIIRPTYLDIDELNYVKYSGYVYSLKISKYELYVADGILTHNSIYGFVGVNEKTFDWFRKYPKTKILPLSYTFRCAKAIVREAQEIVPEIKYLDNAIEGIVREGSVLDEPQDGDFVLCRKELPLIKLFFHYLLEGKKATVKGTDSGLYLLEMIEGHRTLAQLMAFWANKLENAKAKLIKRGVLNPDEDSSYVTLEDNVNKLSFIARLCKDIDELKKTIKTIFSEDLEGIVLSTVHKSKGLEADRVFIARPDFLPLPAPKAWQQQQELNLKYVAITRAKNELVYDNEWKDDD